MENETGFHQRSLTPPDPEDYRAAAVADSTSTNIMNEPVPLYRSVEPNNDAGRPTTAGYVNGGLNINSRPRLPEPSLEERGEGPVSLEVDFDSKMTDAYEKLNDARHGYQVARSASYQYSPERVQNELNPMYKGVQNTAKQERRQARRTCFLHTVLAILIVTNVLALLLGGFNLANTFNVGTITSGPSSGTALPTDPTTAASTTESIIQQLKKNISEIHTNFSQFNIMHSANYSDVMSQLTVLQEIVNTLAGTADLTNGTSPTTRTTTTPPSSASPLSIPLYENCSITMATSCSTNSHGENPSFMRCVTDPMTATATGNNVVTEVFCSVNNDQVKPVTSSLIYDSSSGQWSCVCQGIDILHDLSLPLQVFQCEMYVKRCPSTIEIPQN